MAAILHDDPDGSALPRDLQPAVTTLLQRCLEKDRRQRRRDIGDVRADLEAAVAHPIPAATGAAPRSRVWAGVPWFLAFAGVAVAAATTFWPRWEDPLADAQYIRLTGFRGDETDPAISADGKFVAFLSNRGGPFHIYLTQIGSGLFTDLTPQPDQDLHLSSAGVRNHGFTADGSEIWLTAGPINSGRRFQLVPLLGGGPWRSFLDPKTNNAAWASDGTQIVFTHE